MTSPETPSGKHATGCLLLLLAVLALIGAVAKYGSGDPVKHDRSTPAPAVTAAPAYELGRTGQHDLVYVATLRNSDWHLAYVGYGDSDLVRIGHNVCDAVEAGTDLAGAVLAVAVNGSGIPPEPAAYLTGVAMGAYCSDYLA